MIDIAINSDCRRVVRKIGAEQTPVIMIDDPIVSADALVDYASKIADFGPDDDSPYPGIRADLPSEYAAALMPDLVGLLSHVYDVPRSFRPYLIHQLFSLVTRKPDNLSVLQRMPHTDDRSAFYFATVHYLTSGSHGGTGFFRHRPTKFERITEDRYKAYKQSASEHMAANGPPAGKYIDQSDDQFELMDKIDHRPNRLALYPGNLLHSGLIDTDRDLSSNPTVGRLTANLFIFFAPGERLGCVPPYHIALQ